MFLLGLDIGSSSIKAALVDRSSGKAVAIVQHPSTEMAIQAPQQGWAEQDPDIWWKNSCSAIKKLLAKTHVDQNLIEGIGIAYQMHGLVLVDTHQKVLRPAIIWCDSRAVNIGEKAFRDIGTQKCLDHCLNSPANFTASKLSWVRENEPDIFAKIHKIMLPGDYLAMRLTGTISTTLSGLSEGIFWDFQKNDPARFLLEYFQIPEDLLPPLVPTFGFQGTLTKSAAADSGLKPGIPVTYRAGDQPNNALSLGVYRPGEIAATGGTSGVVYGISDQLLFDPLSRINSFAHVNHQKDQPSIGLLLCINGAGILYAWIRKYLAPKSLSYAGMEEAARSIPAGADGLRILPFGNGAERMLLNRSPGAQINNFHFNRHSPAHFYRAGLEGIAFSFFYGIKILQQLGMSTDIMRVGNDNLFQSDVFATSLASLANCRIEMVETTGAVGAARASGIGAGIYRQLEDALKQEQPMKVIYPGSSAEQLKAAYAQWEGDLNHILQDKN